MSTSTHVHEYLHESHAEHAKIIPIGTSPVRSMQWNTHTGSYPDWDRSSWSYRDCHGMTVYQLAPWQTMWWSGGIRDHIPQWSRSLVDLFWLSISMYGSVYGILGLTLWYFGSLTPTIITTTDPWFHSMGSDHHIMRSSDRDHHPEHAIPKSWISRVGQEWPHGGDPVDFHQQWH